ncbi:unnamed protein product [Lathyrus oleraceus]
MSATHDGVSRLLHLLIRGKFLDHGRISRDAELELMVDYMRVDLDAALREFEATRGAHARFRFLKKVYTYELSATYLDVLYLQYFEDIERIHEYNWGPACLVYLNSKLSDELEFGIRNS